MQIVWTPSLPTTSMYAASVLAGGFQPVNDDVAPMATPAAELRDFLATDFWPPDVWLHLVGFAHDFQPGSDLARRLGRLTGHEGSLVSNLGAHLSAVAAAGRRAFSGFAEAARLRLGPIQRQWEARGPGMIQAMSDWTDPELFVERAVVLLTAPVLGGGGFAYLPGNRVILEGVVANADDQLPEELRLAWLVSQLNLDLPRFSENIPFPRRVLAAQVAMLPPVLLAGNRVGLCEWNAQTLARAITHWRGRHPSRTGCR